jgi:hypothetical protein
MFKICFSDSEQSIRGLRQPYNVEPAKTELTEIGRVTFKKTICFKKTIEGLSSSVLITFSQSNNFTPFLLQFSNNIKVKLKDNVNEFKAFKKQDKYFLTSYSSDNSEESNTDRPKG